MRLVILLALVISACDSSVPEQIVQPTDDVLFVPADTYAGPSFAHVLEVTVPAVGTPTIKVSGVDTPITNYVRGSAPWSSQPGTCPSYCPSSYEYLRFRYVYEGEAVDVTLAAQPDTGTPPRRSVMATLRRIGAGGMQSRYWSQTQP